jgi:hypothetical protein
LSECLDISGATGPQPEFLVEDRRGNRLVVEHKIVVWPPDSLKNHQSHHDFIEYFFQRVSPAFQDDAYMLKVNEREIELKRSALKKIARNIADIVLQHQNRIRNSTGIRASWPVNWSFRRVPDYERDDGDPAVGVGVHLNRPMPPTEELYQELTEAPGRIKEILAQHLVTTCKKFKDYRDCLRIFVTELYGDAFLLDYEVLLEIIPSMDIPHCIDQIWIGYPEWVSENEYVTAYVQARIEKRLQDS